MKTQIAIDETTAQLVNEWADHQKAKPKDPPDYLVHVDHLCQIMDRWTATDEALRKVIGERLAQRALEQAQV